MNIFNFFFVKILLTTLVYLIFLLIIIYKNAILFVPKKQRPEPEKSVNQENFLIELRDQLNEFHIESGPSILEGGELSNLRNGFTYGIYKEIFEFNLSYVALAFSDIAFAFV